MNHKERVSAVLRGAPVDRVPVATWGHNFLREWSAAELAAHTIERHREYNYDFVKLNPRWTLFAEPWGNVYQPPVEQRFPRLTHKVVSALSDLPELTHVSPTHPAFAEHIEALQLVVDAIGDDVDVIATLFSPLSVLGLLAGGVGEPVVTYAREQPELVHKTLQHITETLSGHAQQLVGNGASGLFYAALQWTSLDICDAAFYQEFGRPYDLQVLQSVQTAPLNMFHVCGNNIALPRFFDYPVAVLNWDNFGPGNMSLREASALTSQVVAGGVPHRKLHKLSNDELAEIARDALQGAGANVMLAGGCGVGATVADDIRRHVTQVAQQLGTHAVSG